MPSAHSSIVGGSSAARVVNCHGSQALYARLPEATDVPTVYAAEGTALHQVMEAALSYGWSDEEILAKAAKGWMIVADGYDIKITPALAKEAILPALHYYDKITGAITDDDLFWYEQSYAFPGIAGAHGTCDVTAYDPKPDICHVFDWKFGTGQPVSAFRVDDEGFEIANEQLMFYACGAANYLKLARKLTDSTRFTLHIVQPRIENGVSSVTVSQAELHEFASALQAAIANPTGPLKEGHWCRFALCRTTCPLKLKPLLSPELLAAASLPLEMQTIYHHEVLAAILDASLLLEPIFEEARRQAHEIIEHGGSVEGWKIVAKRANRQWLKPESALIRAFQRMGLKKKDLFISKFVSPAQAEKLLPPGTELPKASCGAISSGTTLAPADDARPELPDVTSAMKKVLASLPSST